MLRLDQVFRFSSYLTLALATWCLAIADEPFLPGMLLFAVPVIVLIWVAFAVEGRWALSLYLSNIIGVLIAAGSGIWILLQITAANNLWFSYAPYPTALLPYGAPALMVLTLGKLFRPKEIKDFWIVHSIGLIEMALACILAGSPNFAFWFFGYLLCCLWSLMLYYQFRGLAAGAGRTAKIRENCRQSKSGREDPRLPWPLWGLGWAFRSTLAVGCLGLAAFLLMPRFGNVQWSILNPGSQPRMGYSDAVDLNPTGPLKVSDEIALEVFAEVPGGKPKLDLPPDQRWRGVTFDYYHQGRWLPRPLELDFATVSTTGQVHRALTNVLPDLGPRKFYLTFNVDFARFGGLLLADPAAFNKDAFSPPVWSLEKTWRPLFYGRDGTLKLAAGFPPGHYSYQQVTLPREAWFEKPVADLHPAYKARLLEQAIPRIQTWTREVLDRLVSSGRLRASDLAAGPDPNLGNGTYLLPENRARVADALADFLARSGEFRFKLEMRRKNFSIDAAEDFLCNVKEGFCEHFATGLVLILRSAGIPARVVNGFRGADSLAAEPDKAGWYAVRQSHAHSWVEALLTRRGPDGRVEFFWHMLDPTPGDEIVAGDSESWYGWWLKSLENGKDFWASFVVGYSLEKQGEILMDLWNRVQLHLPNTIVEDWAQPASTAAHFWSTPWPWLAGVIGLLGSYCLFRRLRGNKKKTARARHGMAVDFYDRFLELFARKWHLQPALSQTPQEFGNLITSNLQTAAPTSSVHEVPAYIVNLYYRVRFGNQPLASGERQEIDRKLRDLATNLPLRNECAGQSIPK